MEAAFFSAFVDELSKFGVSQAWVRGKLKPKGKGKFHMDPRRKFIGRGTIELMKPEVRAVLAGKKEVSPGHFARRGEEIGKELGGKAVGGIHFFRSGKTLVGGRGRPGGAETGMKPRETFHHEMFHRRSPIAPKSETGAYLYGALKSKVQKGKAKHVLKRTGAGLKQDISALSEKFVKPVKHALIGSKEGKA